MLLAFLVLLVVTIAGAGFLLSRDIESAFREERYAQQQGIARLKVRMIDQWVQERVVDLQFLGTSLHSFPSFAQPGPVCVPKSGLPATSGGCGWTISTWLLPNLR